MQRALMWAVLLLISSPSALLAVEGHQVQYVSGTIQGLQEGTLGQLDLTAPENLVFTYPGGQLAIPYTRIESYQYSKKLARRLGVAPTIAVGLVRRRQRNHYFTITYKDTEGRSQVAVLEVSKQMPDTVLAVLKARAPKHCNPQGQCTGQRARTVGTGPGVPASQEP